MVKLNKLIYVFVVFSTILINENVYADKCTCNQESLADIVAPLLPAVVNITVTQKMVASGKGLFRPFAPEQFNDFSDLFDKLEKYGFPGLDEDRMQDLKPVSAGSGFVIDPKGYIVTNYHVVANADKIKVKFSDEKEIDAVLVGSDSRTDLALLKIEVKKDLQYVKFGNSDLLRPGDTLIAIGNPFGLGGTVTTGIVSATSRDINAGTLVDNFIQTDAAINQGNSGGPTFNIKGEVVGINTAIFSVSGGNLGIGFAVPSSFAAPIIEQIKKGGKVHRGWLGVIIQPTNDVAESMGLDQNEGALVWDVAKDSPASKAGIMPSDIILEFDGKKITNQSKLPKIVAETPVGKKVKVVLLSKGKQKSVNLTLEEINDKHMTSFNEKYYGESNDNTYVSKELMGIEMVEMNAQIREKLQIPSDIEGILVGKVDKDSLAYKVGIRKGDIIRSVNQNDIAKIADFEKVISQAKSAGRSSVMVMLFKTKNKTLFIQLPIK